MADSDVNDERTADSSPHSQSGTITCPTCWKMFSRWCSYTAHKKTHDTEKHAGDRQHACPTCPKRFKHKGSLKFHVASKHARQSPPAPPLPSSPPPPPPPKRYLCAVCPALFLRRKHMAWHLRTEHRDRPTGWPSCRVCHETFRDVAALAEHWRARHERIRALQLLVGPPASAANPATPARTSRSGGPGRDRGECVVCAQCYSDADGSPYRCIVCPATAWRRDPIRPEIVYPPDSYDL